MNVNTDIHSRSIPTGNIPQLHSGHQTIAIMKNITHLKELKFYKIHILDTFMNQIHKYLEACLTLITISGFTVRQ